MVHLKLAQYISIAHTILIVEDIYIEEHIIGSTKNTRLYSYFMYSMLRHIKSNTPSKMPVGI